MFSDHVRRYTSGSSRDAFRRLETTCEVGLDVANVFDAYRNPDHVFADTGSFHVFTGKTRVRGARRMQYQRARITDVGQVRSQLQRVDESCAAGATTGHAETKH